MKERPEHLEEEMEEILNQNNKEQFNTQETDKNYKKKLRMTKNSKENQEQKEVTKITYRKTK